MFERTGMRPSPVLLIALAAAVLLGGCASTQAQSGGNGMDGNAEMTRKEEVAKMQSLAQADGYLKAHREVKKPFDLLGGPIEVSVAQNSGGVHVALPDNRDLDPAVFGPDELPRHYGGTPGITGVPPGFRVDDPQGGKMTGPKTPFGDKNVVLPNGQLNLRATDKTATDAAVTEDRVRFTASWEDKAGNTYEVRCCAKMAAHGLEFPTFGGVMTNGILHGFTGQGTPLMPSEFTYVAFWGFGEVRKNGETLDKPRLVHGMLTEYVRGNGYELGFDEDVTPTRRHFHLMVAPFKPVPAQGKFKHVNVNTGFELPNGKELPFWHVMFNNLDIEAQRG